MGAKVKDKVEVDTNFQHPTIQTAIEQYIGGEKIQLFFILLVSLFIRTCVGIGLSSGESVPPKFGDYECHRFWMETTHNLPVKTWYTDGPYMNTTYWPMDYPPLCAYSHWFMSQIVSAAVPEALKL